MDNTDAPYYIEFVSIDNQVKVTAIEASSGIEASVICPAGTPRKAMTDLAMRKLHYILAKKNNA